jgi:hypothetical protein
MLLNVMISMRAHEHLHEHPDPDDPLSALAACAFGDAGELVERTP